MMMTTMMMALKCSNVQHFFYSTKQRALILGTVIIMLLLLSCKKIIMRVSVAVEGSAARWMTTPLCDHPVAQNNNTCLDSHKIPVPQLSLCSHTTTITSSDGTGFVFFSHNNSEFEQCRVRTKVVCCKCSEQQSSRKKTVVGLQ
jgi:hypothetical protein